jgi:hypothetical protein
MKRNDFLILILAMSLLANCFFLYSKFRIGHSLRENETEMIGMLISKESDKLAIENKRVNQFEKLISLKGTSVVLDSLVDDTQKLFLVISDNSCGSCTELSLKALQRIVPNDLSKNIFVLGLYEKKRDFFLLSRQYPFRFFLLNESSILKEIAMKSPVFFRLDRNFNISSSFFPESKYPILTEKYLEQIVKNIKQ